MRKNAAHYVYLVAAGLVIAPALSLATVAAEKPLAAVERPLAPEHNPPGDIPDDQVFIDYSSPQGFSLQVPEGWVRRDLPNGAAFADKYDSVAVAADTSATAPDMKTAKGTFAKQIEASARAVKITKVEEVKLPAGNAVRISYGSNSEPNPVTNKAIRLENDRYYFWKDGKLVSLDLSAPAGADNVDQWTMMANSFRWK